MFDIGWTELLIIGIVALIVVGPKDLPGMFRTLGRVTGKARAMARDFQRAMEQAADDSGVKDMAKEFRDAASAKDFGTDALKDLGRDPAKWARDAARKSILSPEEQAEAEASDAAAGAATRGPATEALA
ncbi:Sec-independent protein translocase protein TatB, partial [Rhodobaculum claviforme]|uniref:Sec-independent protein translocase protein TatB n=1 Tax=Rhodobaculum claviforme TaxID=1549854 RepID=UPI00191206FA